MLDRKRTALSLERALAIFDLPGEAAANVPRITLTGRGRVHIENHRGLVEYGDTDVALSSASGVIRIRGEGITLAAMTDMEIVLTGRISSVEYVL